ncbi:LOW QUALITY PROTEIN: predicted protein, partial [Streptomyces filamentosus NRRL 15998]
STTEVISSFDLHVLSTPPAFVLSQDQTLRECLPVIGCTHTRAEQPVGIRPVVHSVLAVYFKRNRVPTKTAGDGVSTYLALTFGTLLSSQGTDASFGPVSPGPSGRFPSFFFVLLSCVSDSIRLFRVRFPVEAGRAVSLSRFFAFAFSLSGGSNFTRLFFVP